MLQQVQPDSLDGRWLARSDVRSYLNVTQQLPLAHTPDIDVHKVRAAIVPHSSAVQA